MKRAIRKHLTDFLAIIGLIIVAVVVSALIFNEQGLKLPGWVPLFGSEVFELKGEFSSAQAVVPGQGQTVNVAGVQVGDISKVEVKDGRAVVTMEIDPEQEQDVYSNATMLLRPKTGLLDMTIQLDPGSPEGGAKELKSGDTIPIGQTLPNVNVDEFLATLDTDTRNYLNSLIGNGAEGIGNQPATLAATFKRFEPLSRDVEAITSKLKERRRNIARVIHNFQRVSTSIAAKDTELASLVDSSNAVFQSLAAQEANLRRSIAELPGVLENTRSTLAKTDTFANELGPTLNGLRPTARILAPTLREVRPFVREATPIIRDELRPFTRDALPTIRALQPAMRNLSALSPELTDTLRIVNYALNELAYNPPGAEEGFLFWFAWTNHVGASIFTPQDASSIIRRGLVIADCEQFQTLSLAPDLAEQAIPLLVLSRFPLLSSLPCGAAETGAASADEDDAGGEPKAETQEQDGDAGPVGEDEPDAGAAPQDDATATPQSGDTGATGPAGEGASAPTGPTGPPAAAEGGN